MQDEKLNLILYGFVWPPLLVVGIVGNIVNIMVLRRRTLQSSTTVYLLILSISYFLQIVVRILRVTHGFPHLQENYEFRVATGIYNVYVRYPLGNILVCFCNWLTVAMACERCLVVGCVFRARHICTRRNAYIVCGLILLLSAAVNFPRYFEYVPNYARNESGYVRVGSLGVNRTEAYTYISIILVTFLPFGALVPVSAMVIALLSCHMRKLKALDVVDKGRQSCTGVDSAKLRHHRKRSQENRMEANHRSVTILVIASNLLYLVCYGASVYTFFESARLGRQKAIHNKPLRRMGLVSDTLILANTSLASLLYCGCSTVYRREAMLLVRESCCCCCPGCQPPPPNNPQAAYCSTNGRIHSCVPRKTSTMLAPPHATSLSISSNASSL